MTTVLVEIFAAVETAVKQAEGHGENREENCELHEKCKPPSGKTCTSWKWKGGK